MEQAVATLWMRNGLKFVWRCNLLSLKLVALYSLSCREEVEALICNQWIPLLECRRTDITNHYTCGIGESRVTTSRLAVSLVGSPAFNVVMVGSISV